MRPSVIVSPPRLRALPRDLFAGLVVAAVALPLALAFAIASGAPPEAGLITVAVAGGVAALLSGSRFQVTGPTGAFVVVLAGIVAEHGFLDLLLATFMAGILLVAAGLFRLGRLIRFMPYPVVTGFTAGIAVVIFIGQLPDLLGITITAASPEPLHRLIQVVSGFGGLSPWALGISTGTVIIILAAKRFIPSVPGPFLALVAGSVAVVVWALPVEVVGDRFALSSGLPRPRLPALSWANMQSLLPSAFVIALLGAIESLLSAVVADGMTRTRHDPDQELIAQGAANLASPLFGGIAATGAIARTAANVQNGATSQIASLTHAGVILGVLAFAAPYAALVPMPVLAGVLAVVAWNMSERHRFIRILRMPRPDAAVMLVTFALTVAVDLSVAVTFGLLLAMLLFVRRMAQTTRIGELDPETEPGPLPELPSGVMLYSIDGPLFFGAAERFHETLERLGSVPEVLILRMRDVHYMDATAFDGFEQLITRLQTDGCRVLLAGIQSQPLDFLQRMNAIHLIGEGRLFRSTADAIASIQSVDQPFKDGMGATTASDK